MKTRTHTCQATGCQHQIPLHLLMCMDHWRQVPVKVQREVHRAHKAFHHSADAAAALAERRAYLAAVQAAVDAVAAKQIIKATVQAVVDGDLFAGATGGPAPLHSALPPLAVSLQSDHGNNTTTTARGSVSAGGCGSGAEPAG